MLWKKCGAQAKMAFAVVVIALLAGEVSGGWGFGNVLNKKERKTESVGAKADVMRPAPRARSVQVEDRFQQIEIQIIDSRGVVLNGRYASFGELDRMMGRIAANLERSSEKYVVALFCTLDSPHGSLIRVLDICHKYKMNTPNIYSM